MKAAKVRRWLSRPDCPAVLREVKDLFDKAYSPKYDDYSNMGEDPDDFDDTTPSDSPAKGIIPTDLRPLVTGNRVTLQARFKHGGVVYARSSTHTGNSLVYFYPCGNKSSRPVPGSIKYVFNDGGRVAFAVQRQLDMYPGTVDPFVHYPDFPARLYSSSLADQIEKVEVEWVQSHFARWKISREHAVVLNLSKVS
jgi:hypothetical protein